MLSRSVLLKLSVSLFTTASALPGVAQSTIQWTKNTVVVDGNTAQNALTSVSHDGHVLVFNTSDARSRVWLRASTSAGGPRCPARTGNSEAGPRNRGSNQCSGPRGFRSGRHFDDRNQFKERTSLA
jgi:hypothetical protein